MIYLVDIFFFWVTYRIKERGKGAKTTTSLQNFVRQKVFVLIFTNNPFASERASEQASEQASVANKKYPQKNFDNHTTTLLPWYLFANEKGKGRKATKKKKKEKRTQIEGRKNFEGNDRNSQNQRVQRLRWRKNNFCSDIVRTFNESFIFQN